MRSALLAARPVVSRQPMRAADAAAGAVEAAARGGGRRGRAAAAAAGTTAIEPCKPEASSDQGEKTGTSGDQQRQLLSSKVPIPSAGAAAGAATAAAASTAAPVVVLQYQRLVPALLIKRYKRFLGDVHLTAAPRTAAAEAVRAAAAVAAEAADGHTVVAEPAAPLTSSSTAVVHAAGDAAAGGLPAAPVTVIHVPNTGPMSGMLDCLPAEALLSASADPKRKYAHTLEWLRPVAEGSWVGTHSAKANAMVRHLLLHRLLPPLLPYDRLQAELKYGADGKSRVDFVLHCEGIAVSGGGGGGGSIDGATGSGLGGSGSGTCLELVQVVAGPGSSKAAAAKRKRSGSSSVKGSATSAASSTPLAGTGSSGSGSGSGSCCYVEVKSVTLAEDAPEGGGRRIALFPDTVSERAQRHMRELTAVAQAGGRAALVYVVQRDDCCAFAPCHQKDPVYGRLVREAAAAGVLLLPVVCALDPAAAAVQFLGTLPVDLDYKCPE